MERLAVLQRHLLPHAGVQSDIQGLLSDPCSTPVVSGAAAVLVGGMVLDLQACPTTAADVRRGGSVPGRVTQTPGGVARNVAESLARLSKGVGRPGPVLLSAVGDDLAGQALISHWQSLGLSTAGILQVAGSSTPTVAVVFDRSGEVAACVADVGLLELALTPAVLQQHRSLLAAAPVVMIDGNLSPAAIEASCQQAAAAGVPVWFEPVSQPKSVRAIQVLHLLTYISPNEGELLAMAQAVQGHQKQQQQPQQPQGDCGRCSSCCNLDQGLDALVSAPPAAAARNSACCLSAHCSEGGSNCHCLPPSAGGIATLEPNPTGMETCPCSSVSRSSGSSRTGPLPAGVATSVEPLIEHAAVLLRAGVKNIVLTLGPLGAALCTSCPGNNSGTIYIQHLPALPANVVNCSGAGDCLVAGCLFGVTQGRCPLQALACGIAASRAAVESQHNVPPQLSAGEVERGAKDVLARCTAAVMRI